jgi:hypothetical protein
MTARTDTQPSCPQFIVCEDGREYLERFERFLGTGFEFIPAGDYATLLAQVRQNRYVSGILLDLDFRRTEPSQLVNEHGQPLGQQSQEALAMYVANQGLFILASLRERGIQLKVLLFADLDDMQQCEYLKRTFAPLELVPSHLGMLELKNRLMNLGAAKARS